MREKGSFEYLFEKAMADFEETKASFKSLDEFYQFMDETDYRSLSHGYREFKRGNEHKDYKALYEALNIDFNGINFLELGPGWGDAMDIAKERGAKTSFADYDPYINILNSLKGHTGHFVNYCSYQLLSLLPQKYDLIFSRGSISVDDFIDGDQHPICIESWLKMLESITSDKCKVIVCPTFRKKETRHEGGSFYYCDDLKRFLDSNVVRAFSEFGYNMISIEGFNRETVFPCTFYKDFLERSSTLLWKTPNASYTKDDVLSPLLMKKYLQKYWEYLGIAGENGRQLKVAIYGAGQFTAWLEKFIEPGKVKGPEIVALLDDFPNKDKRFFGKKSINLESLDLAETEAIIVASDTYSNQMRNKCEKMFGEEIQIIDLFEGFGDGPFPKPKRFYAE